MEIQEFVYERDGNKCVECSSSDDLTLDHILPQCMDGLHVPGNLRVLCRQCNASRPVNGSDLESLGTTVTLMVGLCLKEHQEIQQHTHACFKHEHPSSKHTQEQSNEIASCPTDSLNLIPDSLNRIPDTNTVNLTFDEFWDLYPRKVGKGDARKSFTKVPDEHHGSIRDDLASRPRGDPQWLKDNGAFIPHPSTYLNQERWSDQWSPERKSSWGSSAQKTIENLREVNLQ